MRKKIRNASLLRVAGDLERLPMNEATASRTVTIFLKQHYGAACRPVVEKGDEVKMGQPVGVARDYLGVDVHSSVSGKVMSVTVIEDPYGGYSPAVIIKNDGQDEMHESVKPDPDYRKRSRAELLNRLRRAGITTFDLEPIPLAAAIDPYGVSGQFLQHIGHDALPEIDTVIVNAVDEEPLTVVNQRLFIDHAAEVGEGVWLMKALTGAKNVFITIKKEHMNIARKTLGGSYKDNLTVIPEHYPEALPALLVRRLTGRTIPAGGSARDVGVLQVSAEIALEAVEAVRDGMPNLYEMFTLSGGAVGPPKILKVRIGTPLRDVLGFARTREANLGKLVLGGPMRGKAQFSLDVPVVKGINTILALTPGEVTPTEGEHCMNCGACLAACPVNLQPNLLSRHCEFFQYDDAKFMEELPACIECGLCGYVCPSRRPMLQYFQNAKHHLGMKTKGVSL